MPIEELVAYFRKTNEPRSEITPHLLVGPLGATGIYRGMHLSSVFQPLFTADGLNVKAYEALLRVRDENNQILSPATAFSRPVGTEEIVYFDRLCRIMHALNFQRQTNDGTELFLNVSGRHLQSLNNSSYGETFERLLAMCGLEPEQIILEVLEARVEDFEHFNEAVEAYRSRGYRVAIDDFGCEHSNFDRLWRLTPDIVKLDRSLILQGTTNPRARRILPKLIEIIHDLGATVVCEGIETLEQHSLAVDAGADLVQGFYYARPAAELFDPEHTADAALLPTLDLAAA